MKITIDEKYIFLYENGVQVNYFENFEEKDIRNPVIKISIEDNAGKKFLNKNNYQVLEADIYWFGRKIKGKPMFIKGAKNSAFSYMVIIQ